MIFKITYNSLRNSHYTPPLIECYYKLTSAGNIGNDILNLITLQIDFGNPGKTRFQIYTVNIAHFVQQTL
jgi:hypothetical protein